MSRSTNSKRVPGNLEAFLEAITDHSSGTPDPAKAERIFRGIFDAGQIAGDVERGGLELIDDRDDPRFDAGLVHRLVTGHVTGHAV